MTNDMMTDTEQQPEDLDEDALRRRLINRIALAGVAIVALLGGLAVIDSMYVAPAAPAPNISVPTISAETSKSAETIALSAVNAQDNMSPVAAMPPEPPHPEAIPTIKSNAAMEESSSPSVPLPKQPHPQTVPAAGKAAAKSSPPQELAHQEPATSSAHTPPPRPLTQGPQAERRFVLQMGVFNNVDNAQELLTRLQKGGVPAQIEARVQVGPFKTKAEADEARTKLKAMGLDAGLLMAIHR